MNTIHRAFYPLYSLPEDYTVQGQDSIDYKAIIARQSRGNTSLQLGNFMTEKDIEIRKKAICDFNFIAK